MLAALALELKLQRAALHLDMAILHGAEANRSVGVGVFLVPDADQRCFQEPHHRGENLFPSQAWSVQIAGNAAANLRQRLAEGDHALVFRVVTDGTPIRVIPILFPSPRVTSGG